MENPVVTFLVLEVLVVAGLLAFGWLVVLMWRRSSRERKLWMPGLDAEAHRRVHGECKCFGCESRKPRDVTTPTCPLCGKYDPAHPFIRHAISCSRKDCAS